MDNCIAYDDRYNQAKEWLLSETSSESRVVFIQRDERGFGFVVAGDNPVFVQSVREGGAAERAGVFEGDVIVKVNGSSVRRANHADVVELIRAGGPSVGLTLVSPPPAILRWLQSSSLNHGMGPPIQQHGHPTMSPPPLHTTPSSRSLHHQPSMSYRTGGITGPQPADMDQQRAFDQQRRTTFKLMLEKEQQYMEEKRSELARGYNPRVADELAKVEKRVKDLQMKLTQLTNTNGAAHVHENSQFHGFHTRSSPLLSRRSPTGRSYASRPAFGRGQSDGGGGWDNLACDVPPPLPARNRSLVWQHSAPNFLHASLSPPPMHPLPSPQNSPAPPPLPPRNPSFPNSPSSSLAPGLGSDAACRSSGSPLTQSWDNLSPGSTASTNLPGGKTIAGGSPLPSHHRTKSSPFPFAAPTNPDTRRFSSSDSISELDVNRIARGESDQSIGEDTTTHPPPPPGTPPGTPPPPYGASSSKRPSSPLEAETRLVFSQSFLSSPDASHSPGFMSSPVLGDSMTTSMMGTPPHLANPLLFGMGQEMQLNIMPMEEDELSDHDVSSSDDHGPFNTLSKLWQHHAHLAVFLNFVVSNCDPASLFFHLITDLYKEGTTKDMKKWAYEIHSTFLVPNAPLKVTAVGEQVLHEIDEVLLVDIDKEEILRKVFWKARSRAKEELKRQLSEFQNKRIMGMGSLFGPVDSQLEEAKNDKGKELKIIDTCLLPCLEKYMNVPENGPDRDLAIASCLATVAGKIFGLKCPQAMSLIERHPSFVAKEKSLKSKFLSKGKKNHTVRGHHFVPHQYFSVTFCNSCGNVLWGIGPQGYQCTNCEMNIHKGCVRNTEENCIGALRRKDPSNNRISKIMEKIRPEREAKRKPNSMSDKHRRSDEKDLMETSLVSATDIDAIAGERPISGSGFPGSSSASSSNGNLRDSAGSRDRRSGTGSGSDSFRESDERHGYFSQDGTPPNEEEIDSSVMPAARRKIVSRSESLRERAQRKHHREKRKHSDPNLPPSHSSDADLEGRFSCNSGSSSNSSLSTRSLESPSPLDNVSSRVSGSGLSGLSSDLSFAIPIPPANFVSTGSTVSTTTPANTSSTGGGTCFQAWDSDIEADPDPPDWTKSLDKDLLEPMTAKEKQRQEVINELFHTERSHVRNLKVLERVFFRPLAENGLMPSEIFALLFANLPDVLEIHARFNALMKVRKREQPVVQQVGDILLEMFDGPAGDSFQRAAAQFCQNQSIALESLKERRKKDSKLQAFLSEAEGNPVCRRLQLKDMIPSVMQRLTKYPLLLESLAKYTPPRSEELTAVRKALERSKDILNQVNQAVKEAENFARLTEIQRRLDRSSFDKLEGGNSEHRNFEFTRQRLLYEGALVWRNKGQKNIDIHMVLLEEYIVVLQKQDDKYILKPHSITCSMGKEESKQQYSPVLKIQNVLVRQVATDKLAFFLVNTSNAGAQMMELVASSMAEKKGWFRHIIDAGEAHAARTKRGEQLAPPSHPIIAPEPEKKDDELLDAQDNVSSDSGVGLTPSTEAPAPSNNPDPPPVVSSSVAENTSNANQETQAQAQAEAVKKSASASQPASPSQSSSPAPQRRFQRVEILKIAEGTPLIEPSEVVVSQGAVLTAEPVLTPLEKLRRKDQLIRTALCDKQRLVADILHVPQHEFEAIAEMAGEAEGEKEARELVLAAILQASRLSTVLNESLRLTEEEAIAAVSEPSPCIPSSTSPRSSRKISRLPGVPAHKLVNISSSINKHLTQLLGIITQRDEERDQLRRELQRYRDLMPSPQPVVPVSLSSASSQTQSRPHSFISTLSAEEDTSSPPALVTGDGVIEPQVNGEVLASPENGQDEGLESKIVTECVNTEVITVIETPLTSLVDQENTIVIPEDADTAKSEMSASQTSEA